MPRGGRENTGEDSREKMPDDFCRDMPRDKERERY